MTRNEPPPSTADLYNEDFFSWTQRQAEALRSLPRDVAAIDFAHVAEEIADLGKRDLREVLSYLGLVIQHLVKLRAAPTSRDAAHWHAEAINFQMAARRTFSPGMRRLVDVEEAWIDGCRAAERFLEDAGAQRPSREGCPFTLDELLAADFDVRAATRKIALG